jgi:hypothetical protein
MTNEVHHWANVATMLILAGAAVYWSLVPYMTGGDE